MVTDERASPTLSWLDRWLTYLAMFGVGLLSLIVTITIISRWVYHAVIPDDVLLVREIMVWVIQLPLAAVASKKMHIAVTIFTDKAGVNTLAFLDKIGSLVGLCFIGLLLWSGWKMFLNNWISGEYYDGDMNIPMWITQAVYVAGLAAFSIRLLWALFSKKQSIKGSV